MCMGERLVTHIDAEKTKNNSTEYEIEDLAKEVEKGKN